MSSELQAFYQAGIFLRRVLKQSSPKVVCLCRAFVPQDDPVTTMWHVAFRGGELCAMTIIPHFDASKFSSDNPSSK
jgi:hypothetical protein